MAASKSFRYDVEVRGFVTVVVKARYHAEALRKIDAWCDKNLMDTQIKDLSQKSYEFCLLDVGGEEPE